MEEIVLKVKNKQKLPFLKELISNLKFVEVIEPRKKLTTKEKKLLNEIDSAIDFVRKHEKGQVKSKSIKELIDEL